MGIFNHKTTNPYISDTNSYYKKSKINTSLNIQLEKNDILWVEIYKKRH